MCVFFKRTFSEVSPWACCWLAGSVLVSYNILWIQHQYEKMCFVFFWFEWSTEWCAARLETVTWVWSFKILLRVKVMLLFFVYVFKYAHFMFHFISVLSYSICFFKYLFLCIVCVTSQGTCTEKSLWKENYIFFFQINRRTERCAACCCCNWCTNTNNEASNGFMTPHQHRIVSKEVYLQYILTSNIHFSVYILAIFGPEL